MYIYSLGSQTFRSSNQHEFTDISLSDIRLMSIYDNAADTRFVSIFGKAYSREFAILEYDKPHDRSVSNSTRENNCWRSAFRGNNGKMRGA